MKCPCCKQRNIGKIGSNHYYCRSCCIELMNVRGRLTLYEIAEDGTVECLNDLFYETELPSFQEWVQ
ncbi:hypothetical protein [Jeotgalibacillus soli]|nr:hypothetical protein [Jeotgalibacillus soli]